MRLQCRRVYRREPDARTVVRYTHCDNFTRTRHCLVKPALRNSGKKNHDAERLRLGAVYTPPILATWAASLLVSMARTKRMTALDPACGDGALLAALESRGVSRLIGVDCDSRAVARAARRLKGSTFYSANGLEFLANTARAGRTLDAVIANPPWGADIDLSRSALVSLGYRTIWGQTDSWELFVEGSLRAVKRHAPMVFILPDALFLPEHRGIRTILANESEIAMIARLGEGFFPDVYRGVVVIATRNRPPRPNALVTCARLSPRARREVLVEERLLNDVIETSSHKIEQARFIKDQECRFDIDTRRDEHVRLSTFEAQTFPWDSWLEAGRGIELSKTGRIVRCPQCATARPMPHTESVTCNACGYRWTLRNSVVETIIRKNNGGSPRGWHPLIVGEDVDRHACVVSRMIRIGVSGIRYKPLEVFAQPKLLVRKTGVGIKASVDKSGAATNQVVFHFISKRNAPMPILDYLEGVLCSRVMLAWHLKRQGEIEWRSHPYITPHMIRRFPVPMPDSVDDWAQVQAIADAVRKRRRVKQHDSPEDLLVERLVAGMYGLSENDMQWVLKTLEAVQQLEPIRTLRLDSASLVAPLRVAGGAT